MGFGVLSEDWLDYGKGKPTMERDQDDSRGSDDWPAAADMIL